MVNKEFDENGNLIRYDSTYTYYYSNLDTGAVIKDSVFDKFNEHLNNSNLFENSFLEDFFIRDYYFDKDFFRRDFDRNEKIINKMMERLDSIKNQFFLREFPLEETEADPPSKN
jgi:hypothetical protein